jgi:PAS domain S-box-containing protein
MAQRGGEEHLNAILPCPYPPCDESIREIAHQDDETHQLFIPDVETAAYWPPGYVMQLLVPQPFAIDAKTTDPEVAILQAMANASPSGIGVVTGSELRIKWINAAYGESLDEAFKGKDLSGMLLAEVLPGYFESDIDSIFRRVAATRVPFFTPEYRYDFFARGVTYWQWSLIALPAPPDAVPDLMFQTIDVTENVLVRKKVEALLLKEEQQWRLFDTALSSTSDFNYVFDLDGRFTYVNQALANLLERTTESIIGLNFFDLGYPRHVAATLQRQIQDVITTKHHVRDEMPFTAPSGQLGYYEYILAPVIGEDRSVEAVAGSTRDITQRKMAERALRDAHDVLETKVDERTTELLQANELLKFENTERMQAEEALRQSEFILRELAAHLESIREDERKRIAREIHDELGQRLLVLRIDISMLHARTGNKHPKLHERTTQALDNIDTTMLSVRSIINNLRPAVLDLGLQAAIEWQVKEFERHTGIACDLVSDGKDIVLSENAATALFRTLQESLTNISRHARATRVLVALHEDCRKLFLQISDNGIGSFPENRRKKNTFGLIGIRERISSLGGELVITSSPDQGVTVTVSVPTGMHETEHHKAPDPRDTVMDSKPEKVQGLRR